MLKKIILFLLSFLFLSCNLTPSNSYNSQETLLTLSNTGHHAIIILNTNNSAQNNTTASTGQTNFNLRALSLKSIPLPKQRPILKDLPHLPAFSGKQSSTPLIRSLSISGTTIPSNRSFYAYQENTTVQITANLVYGSSNTKCLIYVQTNSETGHDSYFNLSWNMSTWTNIGLTFDNQIYPIVTQTFGQPTDVDQNKHIIILYYPMFDSADLTTPNESTLGFFYAGDLYQRDPAEPDVYPNEAEIFYLNLNWAAPQYSEMIRTLPHEFQHMINYGRRVVQNNLYYMDTWINEGMSEFSESIALGSFGQSRIDTFRLDSANKIRNGLSLTIWNNLTENYALSYTFINYAFIQSGYNHNFFDTLLAQTNGVAEDLAYSVNLLNPEIQHFSDLLSHYQLANLLNQSSGLNGYTGNPNAIGKTNFWTNSGSAFDFTQSTHAPSQNIQDLSPSGVLVYPVSTQSEVESFHLNTSQKDPEITVLKVVN